MSLLKLWRSETQVESFDVSRRYKDGSGRAQLSLLCVSVLSQLAKSCPRGGCVGTTLMVFYLHLLEEDCQPHEPDGQSYFLVPTDLIFFQ